MELLSQPQTRPSILCSVTRGPGLCSHISAVLGGSCQALAMGALGEGCKVGGGKRDLLLPGSFLFLLM